jgi:hypothetical protein
VGEARIALAAGEAATGLRALQDAVDDAAESDPAWAPALLELAALNTATGKYRRARRHLDELADLEAFPHECSRLSRALELLGG